MFFYKINIKLDKFQLPKPFGKFYKFIHLCVLISCGSSLLEAVVVLVSSSLLNRYSILKNVRDANVPSQGIWKNHEGKVYISGYNGLKRRQNSPFIIFQYLLNLFQMIRIFLDHLEWLVCDKFRFWQQFSEGSFCQHGLIFDIVTELAFALGRKVIKVR